MSPCTCESEFARLAGEIERLSAEGEQKDAIVKAAQELFWNHSSSEGGIVDPSSELWTNLRDALFPASASTRREQEKKK